jgi:hypothetical protein
MPADNVPWEDRAFGSNCLRELPAGKGGPGAGEEWRARTGIAISDRGSLFHVWEVVSDEECADESSADAYVAGAVRRQEFLQNLSSVPSETPRFFVPGAAAPSYFRESLGDFPGGIICPCGLSGFQERR